MTVDSADHRKEDDGDEAAEKARGRGRARSRLHGGNELAHEVGERRRRHREHRHLPAHVGDVAEEGRNLVGVVAEAKARLYERGKTRAHAAHGEDADKRARKEVADHARRHRLPDGEPEPENVDAAGDAEDGNVPGKPNRKEIDGASVAFVVGHRIDAVGFDFGQSVLRNCKNNY